jgi:hypothetical protein
MTEISKVLLDGNNLISRSLLFLFLFLCLSFSFSLSLFLSLSLSLSLSLTRFSNVFVFSKQLLFVQVLIRFLYVGFPMFRRKFLHEGKLLNAHLVIASYCTKPTQTLIDIYSSIHNHTIIILIITKKEHDIQNIRQKRQNR